MLCCNCPCCCTALLVDHRFGCCYWWCARDTPTTRPPSVACRHHHPALPQQPTKLARLKSALHALCVAIHQCTCPAASVTLSTGSSTGQGATFGTRPRCEPRRPSHGTFRGCFLPNRCPTTARSGRSHPCSHCTSPAAAPLLLRGRVSAPTAAARAALLKRGPMTSQDKSRRPQRPPLWRRGPKGMARAGGACPRTLFFLGTRPLRQAAAARSLDEEVSAANDIPLRGALRH